MGIELAAAEFDGIAKLCLGLSAKLPAFPNPSAQFDLINKGPIVRIPMPGLRVIHNVNVACFARATDTPSHLRR